MTVNRLLVNDDAVSALQHALHSGTVGLSGVPAMVKRVVNEGCWQERVVKVTRETVQFASFEEFVQAGPPDGLGGALPILCRLCADDPEALDAIDRATAGRQGSRVDLHDIVMEVKEQGNASQYAIRRLRTARPDLHKRVIAGELSPHRAMLEAGFRPPTASVRLDNPEAAAAVLARHFHGPQMEQLLRSLKAHYVDAQDAQESRDVMAADHPDPGTISLDELRARLKL